MNRVTSDGQQVWLDAGDTLNAFDPASGEMRRSIDVAADARTAFDGRRLFQLAADRIQKIDPHTGRVFATIPAPSGGGNLGLAWAEAMFWIGPYRARKTHQPIPERDWSWRNWRCRPQWGCQGSSPMAAVSSAGV